MIVNLINEVKCRCFVPDGPELSLQLAYIFYLTKLGRARKKSSSFSLAFRIATSFHFSNEISQATIGHADCSLAILAFMNLEAVRDLHQAGKLSEAEAAYRDLLRNQPTCADAMYGLGMIQFELGRIEDALELLAAAIQFAPNRSDITADLGVVQGTFGRHAQAAETLRRAIELDPASAAAHDNYGVVLDRLHKAEESLAAFVRAVELDPKYFGGLLHLGMRLRRGGRSNEAMDLFERAKTIRPNDAELLRQFAIIFSERGDAQRMIGCYTELLKSPGANPFDYSALVFSMHYNPAIPRNVLFAGAKAWAGSYAEPLTADARPPHL